MTQTTQGVISEQTDPYLSTFEHFEKERSCKDPAWLQAVRKAGISHFTELGFPTIHDEQWRFTNVAPIQKLPLKLILKPSLDGLTRETIQRFGFGGLNGSRLVFVDGHYSPEFSSVSAPMDGVQIGSLATALTTHSAVLEQHLARYARCDSNPFTALNTAFFLDGALILVPKGQIVQDPIHLLFICTSRKAGATAHPRNLIIAQENSQVTVLESYASTVDAPHFTNAVTEIVAGENTVVEHCKIQTESLQAFHVATVEAHVNRSAHYTSHSISTGAKLARNDIHAVLDGEGIECMLNGIFVVNGDQHVDHHTIIDHAKPRCTSHEFYNGVLDGRSKGVFNGKIYVRPNAQKTDAKQTSRNLLLSNEAIVNSQPQLEIFADDVKCTHGSTVGQLNEEAIFYLRSRAIGLEKARQMLIAAFAAEIINRIKVEPVRTQLSKLLLGRLAGEDSSHV